MTRVFKAKKDQLIKDLTQGSIFGGVLAFLWVVEFQKHGLPHVQILIFLADADRPMTPEQVDRIVSAELPPSPFEVGISDEEKVRHQPLWDNLLTNMIHGPCGAYNPHSPCMENGTCTKHFPKLFKSRIIDDVETSHPVYQHCSPNKGGGSTLKDGKTIDNSWFVPYNPYLSLRYGSHTNLEICVTAMASKYLYKLLTKGPDHAIVSTDMPGTDAPPVRNEIRDY